MTRRTVSRMASFVVPMAIWASGAVGAQPPSSASAARQALLHARSLLDRGAFRDAETAFASTIGTLTATDTLLRAEAIFGRAYAAQQRFFAGDTANATEARSLSAAALDGFITSRALWPDRYAVAANNNIGIMFRALSQHDSAMRYFAAAGAKPSRDQASFLLNAGREFDALSRRNPSLLDSARAYYARALNADTTRADALRSLLTLQLRGDSVTSVVRTAARWSGDSAMAGTVASFLPFVLALPESSSVAGRGTALPTYGRSVTAEVASQALMVFVGSLPIARVSPSSFDLATRSLLTTAGLRHSSLSQAIMAVVNAYAPRDSAPYRESKDATWWHERSDRHRLWSSLLRWIGDAYNEQDQPVLAQSYYEAALGNLRVDLNESWIDRSALLPLALIYAEQPAGAAGLSQLDRLVFQIYEAKGPAIAKQDWPRMYDYHLTLGTLTEARGT